MSVAAKLVLQAEGDLLEQRVAEVMAEGVVHFLEAIEIHQHQRQRACRCARGSIACSSDVEEQRAVRQTGQRVVHRLMAQRRRPDSWSR